MSDDSDEHPEQTFVSTSCHVHGGGDTSSTSDRHPKASQETYEHGWLSERPSGDGKGEASPHPRLLSTTSRGVKTTSTTLKRCTYTRREE